MENTVSESLIEYVIESVQFRELIAKGDNAVITEAKWEGSIVAVKEIHSIKEASELELQSLQKRLIKECERSIRLRHVNIVQFLGIFTPPGAKEPSLVMERLYCSLNDLLGTNPSIPLEIKLNILHGITQGLSYLHRRSPPIVHRDLSSKNILISKGMEAKVSDLTTVRFATQSMLMNLQLAPGRQDFMPPEALTDALNNERCGTQLDVFSMGCVMIHTLSHQWPTPQNIISDSPSHAYTELKRRSQYLRAIPTAVQDVMLPMITACLENNPNNRPSVGSICEQLESLITNSNFTLPESTLHAQLMLEEAKQEVKNHVVKLCSKGAELLSKTAELEKLKDEMSKLHISGSTRQVICNDHK